MENKQREKGAFASMQQDNDEQNEITHITIGGSKKKQLETATVPQMYTGVNCHGQSCPNNLSQSGNQNLVNFNNDARR